MSSMTSDSDNNNDINPQALLLALEIADGTARSDIESFCQGVVMAGDTTWYDTSAVLHTAHPEDFQFIDRALHYLDLRGGQTAGFRTLFHPAFPHLLRFEAAP